MPSGCSVPPWSQCPAGGRRSCRMFEQNGLVSAVKSLSLPWTPAEAPWAAGQAAAAAGRGTRPSSGPADAGGSASGAFGWRRCGGRSCGWSNDGPRAGAILKGVSSCAQTRIRDAAPWILRLKVALVSDCAVIPPPSWAHRRRHLVAAACCTCSGGNGYWRGVFPSGNGSACRRGV
jgi:hypothetical protein